MAKNDYDVAIIGAGIGGMCAAARLSHAGYHVLVAEKMPFLGGRFSSHNYKGFELSTGAILIEMGSPLEETFRAVGAPFEVNRPSPQIAYRIDGRDYVMPPNGGLRRLLHHVAQDERDAEKVMRAFKRGMAWQEPPEGITVKEWLEPLTADPKIHGVMQALCAAPMGVNYYEAPAKRFFRLVKAGAFTNLGVAPNGNSHLVRALERVVLTRDGQIWTRTRVRGIQVDKGIAKGILVERNGAIEKVTASAVISNANPRQTIELLAPADLDQGYVRQVREKQRPCPVVAVLVESDRPLMDHPGALLHVCTRRVYLTVTPTIICPDLAPPGRHLLESFGAFSDSLGPVNLREEVEMNLQDLRDVLPEMEKHGRILMVQTFYGDWPAAGTWPGYELPFRTPVELLYNVGDSNNVHATTGLTGCAETARVVVEDIMARMRPGA